MIKLRNEAELARQELHLVRGQMNKVQNNHDAILASQRAALNDDRLQAESRVNELGSELTNMHDKYSHASTIHKKVCNLKSLLSHMTFVLSFYTSVYHLQSKQMASTAVICVQWKIFNFESQKMWDSICSYPCWCWMMYAIKLKPGTF